MKTYGHLFIIFILSFLPTVINAGETSPKIDVIASDLGVPWGMAVMPDNTLLITQRHGELSLLDLSSQKIQKISGLPAVKAQGQGGLFDVALSPDFNTSSWIYFSYAKPIDDGSATTLARAKLQDTALVDWQDLLITQSKTATHYHFGGRITFDNDGHVFLSIGDRGIRENAQNLQNHSGKILRLNLDGSIPKDNPFVDSEYALPEIWSYGHRNPQGLFFNRDTGLLWESEHGPRGGDEVNLIQAGNNYGWPVISYGKEYRSPRAVGEGTERADIEAPVKVYIPSIATSNIIQYSGKAFPAWKNNLFIGALKAQHLNRLVLDEKNHVTDEFRHLSKKKSRIRNCIESPEGWLYIATDQGDILRVMP